MTLFDKIQLISSLVGIFLIGFCFGDACGWQKAERWFWATREKK